MRKLLHWIACHNVLLVLLFFLVVAIIFREPLFGIKPSSDESVVTENNPVVVNQGEEVTQKIPSETPPDKTENDTTASPVIQVETADDIQQREQYDFRPPEEAAVEESVDEDLLQQARKAYWNDQLDTAQKFYLDYIEQEPSNPDGYGELGNLLSTIGELDKAAEMYRKAADLLENQGDAEQAAQLQEVLESIRVIQTENQ